MLYLITEMITVHLAEWKIIEMAKYVFMTNDTMKFTEDIEFIS